MKNSTKIVPTNKIIPGIMAVKIQYSLCLLAAVLILNTTSFAQQQNASISKQLIQSSANSGNVSRDYRVTSQNGKLILSDGKKETIVSSDPGSKSPLVCGDEIFYIGQGKANGYSSGSSIYDYNIKTKATEDVISPYLAAGNYDSKNVVENLLQDKTTGKLYFSTSSKNKRGYAQFLTWTYEIKSKELAVYKDGRIESIDDIGNQVIVFTGFDSKGKYTSRSLVGSDGDLIKVLGKEYAAQTIK